VSEDDSAKSRLEGAVSALLETVDAKDGVLWSLSYRKKEPAAEATPGSSLHKHSPQTFVFAPRAHDIAFDDGVLDAVKETWETVLGKDTAVESSFLRFEEREGEVED
jgi:hypothetical protein